jgi:hypothetical protein
MLDSVEATIAPGHGRADAFIFANGTAAGAGAEVAARINTHASVFARGWIGEAWDMRRIEGEALGGLRLTW